MNNEVSVAQPDNSGQDVTVEITPLFADDNALRAAYTEALNEGVSPDAIVKGWCKIAKLALKTGEHTKFSGRINNVSKRVPINAKVYKTVAFRVLENAGMITVSDAAPVVREVTDKNFEDWWTIYPARQSNGRPVKKGKVQAKNWFVRKIVTKQDYTNLTTATLTYAATTNAMYIKDAERFLRHDLWRDYLATAKAVAQKDAESEEATTGPISDSDSLNKLMGVVNASE